LFCVRRRARHAPHFRCARFSMLRKFSRTHTTTARFCRVIFFAAAMVCATQIFAADAERAMNFANDVVPVLTKASCNSGACHAKAGLGQRGFKLSLLGFEPQEDYEHIVKEGHGRRVFPGAPEQSLLLLKAANTVPHGGGKKLDPKSEGYQTIVRWISQGMPSGKDTDPVLTSIDVQPKRGTMKVKSQQQLKVLAHYSDGSVRDVTHTALYEANDKNMAETDEDGLVRISDLPGNVAVMVRYQGLVSVFSASIPLGAAVENLPPAKNLVPRTTLVPFVAVYSLVASKIPFT